MLLKHFWENILKMSCSKCKKTTLDQKPPYQCDLCHKYICNECSPLTSTEDRCMGLSKQRTLKFFCPECDRSIVDYSNCIEENQKVLQENKQILKKLLEVQTKSMSGLANMPYVESVIKKCQDEMQVDLTETIRKLIKNEITEVKQEIHTLRESNKDMLKIFSETSSNSTATKPAPLFRDVLKQQSKVSNNSMSKMPRNENKEKSKPANNNILQVRNEKINEEPKRSEQHTPRHTQMPLVNNSTDGYQEVTRRKPRRKKQIGTAETHVDENAGEGFEGRQEQTKNKKIWIFISKAKDNVTEDVVRKYISRKANTEESDISVKQIKTYYQAQDNNCFLIGVNPNLIDMVYDVTFWPLGIAFDRFNFYRGRQFLDKTQDSQMNQRTDDHFLSPK